MLGELLGSVELLKVVCDGGLSRLTLLLVLKGSALLILDLCAEVVVDNEHVLEGL